MKITRTKARVLITGGAGYIGSVLAGRLLDAGHEVIALDALWFGVEGVLAHSRHVHDRYTFIGLDLRDLYAYRHLYELVGRFDVMVHLAAVVGYPACEQNQEAAQEVNVNLTLALLSGLPIPGHFIFASTGSIYGNAEGFCDETTPLNPLTHYARTKVQAEKYIVETYGRHHTIFRFATAYGLSPRLRLDLLPNDFAYTAVHEGRLALYQADYMRAFVHVEDIASAIQFAIENPVECQDQTFNLATENLNKGQLAQMIAQYTPCEIVAAQGEDKDGRNYSGGFDKLASLGWSPSRELDSTIQQMVGLFRGVRKEGRHVNASFRVPLSSEQTGHWAGGAQASP